MKNPLVSLFRIGLVLSLCLNGLFAQELREMEVEQVEGQTIIWENAESALLLIESTVPNLQSGRC